MIPELGNVAIALACAVALVQAALPLAGAHGGRVAWMQLARPAASAQFGCVAIAFAALSWSFYSADFSVAYVASNSNSILPWYYRLTAVWGGHEGSMLLWMLVLAGWTLAVALASHSLPLALVARVLGVLGAVSAGFLLFILLTSNPFARLNPAPVEGSDLNPLLQDIGMIIHPPMLYMGYVGMAVAFGFAIAALLGGRLDAAWARWARPWVTVAWLFLTAGVALGSWWAYYELGWGGWWFWDPVENASFMPWLLATALLHSAIVVEKRSSLKTWTILLAILAFSLSLIGTFLVRSGVITSVHAFANDPDRGVFILAILAVAIIGSLTLFIMRAPSMRSEGVFQPVSREGALIYNNLVLAVSCAVVFVGTLGPLFREFADGAKISVGAPFYDLAFTPFMVILMLALPVGALLPWKRGNLGQVMAKLWWAGAAALAVGGAVWALQEGAALLAPVGIALAAWLILGALVELWERGAFARVGALGGLKRLAGLPRADWGKWLGHAGLALTALGIAGITAWETEDIRLAQPGDVIQIGPYNLEFEGVERVPAGAPFAVAGCGNIGEEAFKGGSARNFDADVGRFKLLDAGDSTLVARMCPEKRRYPVQQMPTTEAAIHSTLGRDVYVVLGDRQADGEAWAVRSFHKPLAVWIWLGCLVMGVGGIVSLTDRRFRIGAVSDRRGRGSSAAVPAE